MMSEYQLEISNSPDEISLREAILKIRNFIRYLKTKWKIIFLSGMLGGLIGFGYAYLQKPLYTATLSFVLEDDKSGGTPSFGGLASQFGLDGGTAGGGVFSGSNLFELMKSRTLVEKTLLRSINIDGKKISLADFYINFSGLRDIWKDNPEFNSVQFNPAQKDSDFSVAQNRVLNILSGIIISKMLSVSQKDKKTSISFIDVTSENEFFSKYFAELLVSQVSEFYIETKSKKAKLNVTVLQKQTDSIRAELNEAISGVASANDNTYNLNPALNIKRVPSARRQFDVQANTVMLTQLVQNLELAKVSLRKETPFIQVIDTPVLPLKMERVSKMKSLISGAGLTVFFSIIILACIKWWKNILKN